MCPTTTPAQTVPYETGKIYAVQVAILKPDHSFYGHKGKVPVLGPKHEDKDIIGFPHPHYHVDWRFVTKKLFNTCGPWRSDGAAHEFAKVLESRHVERLETVRLKMRRPFRVWPVERAKWFNLLQDAYQDKTAHRGICPHKGADMKTLPVDADGCVTCPLHGLKWDAKTWQLKRQDIQHTPPPSIYSDTSL